MFLPTVAKAHGSMNLFSIILIFIVLAYESHTKVGEKMKILLKDLPNFGKVKKRRQKKRRPSVVKVTQPISRAGIHHNTLHPC